MEVFQCGTQVILKNSNYEGIITAINIRDNRVSYEVSYYEVGIYKSIWISDYQFIEDAFKNNNKIVIGFKGESQ